MAHYSVFCSLRRVVVLLILSGFSQKMNQSFDNLNAGVVMEHSNDLGAIRVQKHFFLALASGEYLDDSFFFAMLHLNPQMIIIDRHNQQFFRLAKGETVEDFKRYVRYERPVDEPWFECPYLVLTGNFFGVQKIFYF